ncbi:MAG: SDR family NAD(P)-dependent oxidoreductase [Ktedonobacteraceae bacterium]
MGAPQSDRINLSGPIAVVTGAAKGIGQATALTLAREGASIVALDVLSCDETTRAVRELGQNAIALPCDVSNVQQVHNAIAQVVEQLGRPHILVTCAGIVSRTSVDDMIVEEWDRILAVDLRGTFLCVQAVYPHMKALGYGKIVCVGSIAGKVGGVISGPHYVAAKGGVHAFIKWMAKDAAPHSVYVNAVAPSPVWTDMTVGHGLSRGYGTTRSPRSSTRPGGGHSFPCFICFQLDYRLGT